MKELILYGAGRFGKAAKKLLEKEEYCEIVAWADKEEKGEVISPLKILDYNFDKLMLAVINAAVADDIEEMLINLGIKKQIICRIDFSVNRMRK